MSAREVDRSDDSAATSTRRKAPPSRMRNYRIVAEPRTDPDLHKLAQLSSSVWPSHARTQSGRRGATRADHQQAPQAAHWAGRSPRSGRPEAVGGC